MSSGDSRRQSAEHRRLEETRTTPEPVPPWRKWGPYVADRAWGTVREDYSADGNAWSYFPHDQARSRAYRWNEDGIAGICDRYQVLCFSLAFWNGQDPILKERFFGVDAWEGNHGEDVKECYFHLDNTPTHSFMRMLYKYPQKTFPYQELVDRNRQRSNQEGEFELWDTGIFSDQAYFDIQVDYAKATPEDLLIRVEIFNRYHRPASLDLLGQIWFRNTWSWESSSTGKPSIRNASKKIPVLEMDDSQAPALTRLPFPYRLGKRWLYGEAGGECLFTENETNHRRLWGGPNVGSHTKDAFHQYIIEGEKTACGSSGTKAALRHAGIQVPAGGSVVIRFRLSDQVLPKPFQEFDSIWKQRQEEADEFYKLIQPTQASADEKLIQRQALAGLLWSKQFYHWDVHQWLEGDNPALPPDPKRSEIRNQHWQHLNSMRILSMPDKWEYPWFAAWDLAFQAVPLALVDSEFAKEQLWLMLFEQFQHPNGQIPAYEWEFSDLNPPVHAWAVWRVYNMDRIRSGRADRCFLERCFHKLLINFAWWVNKVDAEGNCIFEGGFLGLDNIAVVDRSERLEHGARVKQSDATGWMGMFCLNLMRIALELAKENRAYESLATKFFQHFIYIGAAMKNMGGRGWQLWDEQDGFFYDVLHFPDGRFETFRLRSLVGIIPLFAVERLEENWIEPFTEFRKQFDWFVHHRPELASQCVHSLQVGGQTVHLLSIMNPDQMQKLLARIYRSDEFLSDYGLRSLSKHHEQHPFHSCGKSVYYEPGESASRIKGGNSNWRGPVWFPTSFMMIESLRKMHKAFGEGWKIENEHGNQVGLETVCTDFSNRLIHVFLKNGNGMRPVHGGVPLFGEEHWRDLVLFYEYFHAETGQGLGAAHQTGWTALVACLIDEWRE